jgi:hypothetical protein
MDRAAAIALGAEVVECLVVKLLSAGQNPKIDRDDLRSVGITQAIRTVDRNLGSGGFPLNKAIARDAKTIMLRFIAKEKRDARYRRGRDTDGSVIPRRLPASIWMGRDRCGYFFPELHPKFEYPVDMNAFCMEPVQDCTVSTPRARPEQPRDAWGCPIDPTAERERARASAALVQRMRELESQPFTPPTRRRAPAFRFCLFGPANFSMVHSMAPAH